MSRRKGDVIYTDEDLLNACRQMETQLEFEHRTGIHHVTIIRRFGSFKQYKEKARINYETRGFIS